MKKSLLLLGLLALPALGADRLPAPPRSVSNQYFTNLVNAIYRAEGGARAKFPYGIIAPRKLSEAEARRWCFNTVRNNWTRWEAAGRQTTYLEFLAGRYAPIGAANDPRNLNQHWLKNVNFFLTKE